MYFNTRKVLQYFLLKPILKFKFSTIDIDVKSFLYINENLNYYSGSQVSQLFFLYFIKIGHFPQNFKRLWREKKNTCLGYTNFENAKQLM